jgi:hypothetical protein
VPKNTNLSPDGFATHRCMFLCKPVPHDGVLRPSEFLFGKAVPELYDCLKITMDDAAFCQVVQYLQNLCPKEPASAILFDCCSFWLTKSHRLVIVKIKIAKWTSNGTESVFIVKVDPEQHFNHWDLFCWLFGDWEGTPNQSIDCRVEGKWIQLKNWKQS